MNHIYKKILLFCIFNTLFKTDLYFNIFFKYNLFPFYLFYNLFGAQETFIIIIINIENSCAS